MFVFQAFRNNTFSSRSEHKSFPKHCFWGVPECLFFKHSGTSQFPLDQNTNHSQNIVFRGFQNVCFSSIPEQHNFPQIRTQITPKTLFLRDSGMFVIKAFWNPSFLTIPEMQNCSHIRTTSIPKTLFFRGSGISVFSGFRNGKKTLFSEPKTFLKHCFFGIPEHFVFDYSRTTNSNPIQERFKQAISGMTCSTQVLELFWVLELLFSEDFGTNRSKEAFFPGFRNFC